MKASLMKPRDEESWNWRRFGLFWARLAYVVLAIAAISGVVLSTISVIGLFRSGRAFMNFVVSSKSGVTWVFSCILLSVLLCFPGFTAEIRSLVRRMKSFGGGIEFVASSSLDLPSLLDDGFEATGQHTGPALEEKDLKSKSQAVVELKELLLKTYRNVQTRNAHLIQQHAGRIGAVVENYGGTVPICEMRFEGILRRGEEQILVKILPNTSPNVAKVLESYAMLLERLKSRSIRTPLLHILLFVRSETMPTPTELASGKGTPSSTPSELYSLYRYWVTRDNAVRPLENPPCK